MRDSSYGDFKNRRQRRGERGVWHFLNRFMWLLICAALLVIIGSAFIPLMQTKKDQAARIAQLKAEVAHQKELLSLHAKEAQLLKSDPDYIETVARDRLNLMKKGETIYRIEAPKKSASPTPTPH